MKEVEIKKEKGSLILKLSLGALTLFAVVSLFGQQIRINDMKAELSDFNNQIKNQQLINDRNSEAIEDSKYDKEDFAEKYAREEFNYANQDERVFINIGGN